jgi:phage terminase large subunit-like protein
MADSRDFYGYEKLKGIMSDRGLVMRFSRLLVGLAGAAMACAAVPASAIITLNDVNYTYGPPEDVYSGGIRVGTSANGGPVGQFTSNGYDTTPSNIVSFLSFCIDVTKPFRNTMEFEAKPIGDVFADATRRNRLAAMLINGDREIKAATTTSAARQIASAVGLGIWEIIYEETATGYDVTDGQGNFNVYGDFMFKYDGLVDLTNDYLAKVETGAWTGDANRIGALVSVNGEYQNQIYILSPVPEPATWAQLILGLGIVGGALRWRRRRKLVTA